MIAKENILAIAILILFIVGIFVIFREVLKEKMKNETKSVKNEIKFQNLIGESNTDKNVKYNLAKDIPFVSSTSSNIGFVLDEETKNKLINSDKLSFRNKSIFAKSISGDFLKKGYKIWLITRHPGWLDRPASSIGVVDTKLVLLADLASTIDFYNQAVIVPNDKFLVTSVALDILKVAYSIDEFQYGTEYDSGDDVSHARGYKVISSIKAIKNYTPITDNYVSLITKPTTLILGDVGKAVFKTTIWFWGAHNCELHRFDMMSERAIGTSLAGKSQFKITGFKDEVITKLGKCSPLFYK